MDLVPVYPAFCTHNRLCQQILDTHFSKFSHVTADFLSELYLVTAIKMLHEQDASHIVPFIKSLLTEIKKIEEDYAYSVLKQRQFSKKIIAGLLLYLQNEYILEIEKVVNALKAEQ